MTFDQFLEEAGLILNSDNLEPRPSKERAEHYLIFALDTSCKKLVLLDCEYSHEDAVSTKQDAVDRFPSYVQIEILHVDPQNPNHTPARNLGLLCLWMVDNGIIGAECSKLLEGLEKSSGEHTLRPNPNWVPAKV